MENVNNLIAPKLTGMDVRDQKKIDEAMVQELDGTKNEWGWCKSKLGAAPQLARKLIWGLRCKGHLILFVYIHVARLCIHRFSLGNK